MIVDACCGGLNDHNSWEKAGAMQVLAIDQEIRSSSNTKRNGY
jgi:hypothetical protein